jgi:hypothetical protein
MRKLNWLFSLILVVACLLPFAVLPEQPVLADSGKSPIVLETPIELRDMGSYYRIFNGAKTYHFGKNGVNEIWSYDESVLMLDNEQFRIEVGGVVKPYSSVEVSYKVVSTGHYEVIQTYVCDKGTQYTSVYTIKYGQPLTAECTVKSGEKQDYKVLWDFDGTSSYENITNGIKYDNGLNIRWDDVKATLGDITSVKTYLDKSQTKVDAISFNIGSIDAGKELKLDPVAGGGNTYWVNGSGNWSDGANHWSDSSGGAANASYVPDAGSPVFFDGNSSLGVGWTITVDAAASCLDMDWTGATNTPTLALAANINADGNVIFINSMLATQSPYVLIMNNGTLTTNSFVLFFGLRIQNTLCSLADDLVTNPAVPRALSLYSGELRTNNHNISVSTFGDVGTATAKTFNLGSSTINSTSVSMTGSNNTFTPNTATINCSGSFAGGGLTTYNIVNLTGATSTVSGNNSFSQLNLVPANTQAITFTAGTTQNVSSASLSGSAGHVHTLTGAGSWTINKLGGGIEEESFLSLVNSNGSPASTWYYYTSTIGAGVTNWNEKIFAPTTQTDAATVVEETTATLNGQSLLDGNESCQYQFFYGDTIAYGSATVRTGSINTSDSFASGIAGLTRGKAYHFKASLNNSIGVGNGSDRTFITKPNEPTALTVTVLAYPTININWTRGTGATNTVVVRKIGSYPANVADGTTVYNSTGVAYTDAGLAFSTDYYYRAWSWATEEGLSAYSDAYTGDWTTTPAVYSGAGLLQAVLPLCVFVLVLVVLLKHMAEMDVKGMGLVLALSAIAGAIAFMVVKLVVEAL